MTSLLQAPQAESVPAPSKRAVANRLNAKKSTGPKSEAGKAASRRNALKTGFAGKGDVLPDEVRHDVRARIESWTASYDPQTQEQKELVEQGATAAALRDRCWAELEQARLRAAERAATTWDEDRTREAEALAARIGTAPALTVARLRLSLHGVKKLHSLWTELGRRLELDQDWNDDQRELALDLLGVHAVFRDEASPVDLPGADPDARMDRRLDVVVEELLKLENALEGGLAELDSLDRQLLASGSLTDLDPDVRRLARYESSLTRRAEQARRKLAALGLTPRPTPVVVPQPSMDEVVTTEPTPAEPSNETKPTEVDVDLPIAAAPRSVGETKPKFDKAEARRAERLIKNLPPRRRREAEARTKMAEALA